MFLLEGAGWTLLGETEWLGCVTFWRWLDRCVKTAVMDYGPSCFVENDAGKSVVDASPVICQALSGRR